MSLTLITGPAGEPLSLAELKAYLRVSGESEDTLIGEIAIAARRHVEALTGLALVTQSWRLTLDQWPSGMGAQKPVALARPPVQAVTGVSIHDGDDWQAMDEDAYTLVPGHPARLLLERIPPRPAPAAGGIRIDFTAGFGNAASVPQSLKQAIRYLAAHYHERRTPHAETRIEAVPDTVAALLAPWREVRL